jgi:hypothetical protein
VTPTSLLPYLLIKGAWEKVPATSMYIFIYARSLSVGLVIPCWTHKNQDWHGILHHAAYTHNICIYISVVCTLGSFSKERKSIFLLLSLLFSPTFRL